MMFESLVIGIRRGQLLRKLHSWNPFSSGNPSNLSVIFFSIIFILVASNQHLVKGAEDSGSSVGFVWTSPHSVLHGSFEGVCPPSKELCFPSTLNAAEISEREGPDPSFLSGGFSYELKEMQSNLSFLSHHRTFRVLDGKTVSCFLCHQDGLYEVSSSENVKLHEHSHHVLQLGKRLRSQNSSIDTMNVKIGFVDGSSPVPLEISPSIMDWGNRNLRSSSLAFLTVKNVDADNILRIYDLYSSSMQFYSCNFSELWLAPGEVASLCFVFAPSHPGFASGQLVVQTTLGGFVIQAKGFAVGSPYLEYPISLRELSSMGMSRKEFYVYNPFDEVLHIREVIAWISTSSESNPNSSISNFHIENIQNPIGCDYVSAGEWKVVERAEAGHPEVALRMPQKLEVAPYDTQSIVQLDISGQGKALGALSMKFLRPLSKNVDTLIIPFEAELIHNSAVDVSNVSSALEGLVTCRVSLSVRNQASHIIGVTKMNQVGENAGIFQIRYVEGLILFPRTVTQVAILSYTHVATHELSMDCNVMVFFNDTKSSHLKIPCLDVANVCARFQSNSSVGFTKTFVLNYIKGEDSSLSGSIQLQDAIKVDEVVLGNWKSHAAVDFMSVLDNAELLFPKVTVGNYSSRWITVTNPSQEPVVVQLILNPSEVYFNCRSIEMSLQPSSYFSLVGNQTTGPTRYGFSVSKNALTEAVVHPFGSAALGPLIFQPSDRCEWRGSALVRNNLSGVEWIYLKGYGSSLSLIFLEKDNLVQSLDFQFNLKYPLNDSPDSSVGRDCRPCSRLLNKEVHIKNTGDLSLEVKQIHISGAKCGLDGFMIKNCAGFSLQPGESASLHIVYKPGFYAPAVRRDLELVLTNGILFIPMKVDTPLCVLSHCRRWALLIRIKSLLVLLLSACCVPLVILLLFPHITVSAADSHRGRKISLQICPKWKKKCAMFTSHMGHFSEFVAQEMSLASRSSKSSEYEKQLSRIFNTETGTQIASEGIPRTSSTEDLDVHGAAFESHLRVRVRGEKARRRKKKKSPGPALLNHEVSSSQSGNSTPSSPLSPISFATARRPLQMSASINPALLRYDQDTPCSSTCSSSKTNYYNYRHEGGSSTEKSVIREQLLAPSATWPGACRPAPDSPDLVSTSKIAPHARAPGTKIGSQDDERMEFDQKYTFDIWGDHPYSLPSPLEVSANGGNSSESFFSRSPLSLSSMPADV